MHTRATNTTKDRIRKIRDVGVLERKKGNPSQFSGKHVNKNAEGNEARRCVWIH